MKNRKQTVSKEQIDAIVKAAVFSSETKFDKTTVVSMKLPNGFVLVESSSCVDPDNYDYELGVKICKERLVNKVWELEGYKLQDELYRKSQTRPLEDVTIGELIEDGYNISFTCPCDDLRGKIRIEKEGY